MDELAIRIKGGGTICVPSSPAFMTPHVLLEQEDWFEKELTFVRRVLRPGMRVADVGANYGFYTVAMAQAVGPDGAVWAFEPASRTAAYLRRSMAHNGLGHVVVKQMALSDRQGHAHLRLEDNPELNAISAEGGSRSEQVTLTTLDQEWQSANFGSIDFIKLDAEGEEIRIVSGGHRLFAEQSPLVMFELKHGATVNVELLSAFRDRGYGLYRLIGPDRLLVPFGAGEAADTYELNLFACKSECAGALTEQGLLARPRMPETIGHLEK
jgi:FkbM family methyltransferase